MRKQNIQGIPRIDIDLLELKSKKDLEEVYLFYKKSLDKFFTRSGHPQKKFFKDVDCPVCQSRKRTFKISIDHFDYVECGCCKVVYNHPQLKDEYVEKMYATGEYATYFKKMVVKSQALRKNVIEQRKYKQIASFFTRPGRILDVGCGSGSFLKVFKEHGWEVVGLEPSQSAKKYAQKTYDIDVIQKTFETYQPQQEFDCVTFWGLEHLSDPMGGMKKAVQVLARNGLIVFESPSADGFLMKYLERNKFSPYRYIESARHVLFFSRNSIEWMCKKLNLELAYLESNGLDIQTILPFEFQDDTRKRLRQMQRVLDENLIGDHYRVFLKKKQKNINKGERKKCSC